MKVFLNKLALLLLSIMSLSNQTIFGSFSSQSSDPQGNRIEISSNQLERDEKTNKDISDKLNSIYQKSEQEARQQKKKFDERLTNYLKKNFYPPIKKRQRLLALDSSNQFSNKGDRNQARYKDYIYSIRGSRFTIHQIKDIQFVLIYEKQYQYPDSPREVHAHQNYFALIFQKLNPNSTVIRVFEHDKSKVKQIRNYQKEGIYITSRYYKSYIVILTQQAMKSKNLDYTWAVDGKQINQSIFQGVSGNKTANNIGNAARSFAKIQLGSSNWKQDKFATFILCDYAWDFILTESLNIIVPGNNYNSTAYTVCFQRFSFNENVLSPWGSSRWAVLPGLINSIHQISEYYESLQLVLLYTLGDWGEKRHVSVARFPLSSFDPQQGLIKHNLGIQGSIFVACSFRKDAIYLIFEQGKINVFPTSDSKLNDEYNVNGNIFQLYPYGPRHLIGFGATSTRQNVALFLFDVSQKYKIKFIQSIKLNSSYSYSLFGWLQPQYLQFNWATKLVTFPIFTSESEPYRKGYYQVYINPQQGCMSSVPVEFPCQRKIQNEAEAVGKVMRHWKMLPESNYTLSQSQQILRSQTIQIGNSYYLLTTSECQLQSREIGNIWLNEKNREQDRKLFFLNLCS